MIMWLSLALLALGRAAEVQVASAADLVLAGGAEIQANPLLNLHSGRPGQGSSAALVAALAPGAVVDRLSFAFRYITGYGHRSIGLGANFSVRVAGQTVYTSPEFRDFSYDDNNTNYSAPVLVDVGALGIEVRERTPVAEIDFLNNDNNVQLLLPIHVTLSCKGEPCIAPEPLKAARIFSDHMVLQRAPKSARIWGSAAPNTAIAVLLDMRRVDSTTTDAAGHWELELPPQDASYGRQVTVQTADDTLEFTDVAFGDVFLCSGQSHMQFSVGQDMNSSSQIAESGSFPGIRMLTVGNDCQTVPVADIKHTASPGEISWLVSQPESFGSQDFSYPSAICYFHAKQLYQHFNGSVPIGTIGSSVGGSAIEFWMDAEARGDTTCGNVSLADACPDNTVVERTAEQGWTHGCFFNGMIAPLGRLALRGILWDQGEANDGDSCTTYGCKLASLAQSWRLRLFQQPDLLFGFDQLRADAGPVGLGAQGYAKAIPHSIFATRSDLQTCLAEHTSQGHATRKLEVGRRLALKTLVAEYGEEVPLAYGPSISGIRTEAVAGSESLLKVTVVLDHSDGLHHADAPECDGCCLGQGGPLVQGSPKTGDAWSFVLMDGSHAAVCHDASLGCDGSAMPREGAIEMLVRVPEAVAAAPRAAVAVVLYGGVGPWLGASRSAGSEQCVYPHDPRFGLKACELYNGVGDYDAFVDGIHGAGIAMAAQWFNTSEDRTVVV